MFGRKHVASIGTLVILAVCLVLFLSREKWAVVPFSLHGIEMEEVHVSRPVPTARTETARTEHITAEPTRRPAQIPSAPTRLVRTKPRAGIQPAPLEQLTFAAPASKHRDLAPLPVARTRVQRTPRTVKAIVAVASRKIREAYRLELRRNPDLRGQLRVRFLVEPLGRVKQVQILGGELSQTDFARTVAGILAQMVFPAREDGGQVEAYRQTFVFRPRG